MKTSVVLACLFAGSFTVSLHAQTNTANQQAAPAQPTQGAKANPPTKTAPKAGSNSAPTAANKAGAADAKAKKAEAPATIPGVTIPRGKKFLGVEIVEGTFKLSFYDEKKKPVQPDVPSAVLRWDTKTTKSGRERVMLTTDGKALVSPRIIRPPYSFKLTIILLNDTVQSDEGQGESFVIDFSQ